MLRGRPWRLRRGARATGVRQDEPMSADAPAFYFCLKHRRVEGEEGCKASDRLGPYASEAEASRALEKVQERNEAWDNDPDWNDPEPGSGTGNAGA